MAAIVQDLKTQPRWQYRKYTDEEVQALTTWLASPQCFKEMIMSDNLWENMKKLSTRVGIHTHPVFEYTDQYLKMATKDVISCLERPSFGLVSTETKMPSKLMVPSPIKGLKRRLRLELASQETRKRTKTKRPGSRR